MSLFAHGIISRAQREQLMELVTYHATVIAPEMAKLAQPLLLAGVVNARLIHDWRSTATNLRVALNAAARQVSIIEDELADAEREQRVQEERTIDL